MKRLKAWLAAAVLPALAGLAAAGGQAPFGLWALSLFGFAALIWHVAGADGWRPRAFRAWAGGVGYFAGTLFWIVEPFLVEPEKDGWMAPFALIFMTTGMALFWMAAGFAAGLGRNRAGRSAGFALGLAASDLARTYVLTGFPWVLAGHIWIDTPVAQAAAFVGPVGLSILTLTLAALPVAGATRARQVLGAGLAGILLAAVWAAGGARLAAPDAPREPAIRVRIVQPNATQHLKWQPGMWRVFLDRMITAGGGVAAQRPDLIVWPETSVPYLLEDAGPLFDEALAVSGGVPMAVGIQRAEGVRYYNTLAAIGADGRVVATYDKQHLVPFGEYIPLGDLLGRFGISAFAAQAGYGYTAGPGARVLDLGRAGKVLPLICYEAVFPQDLRAAPERADWILQVTNDGWFGQMAGPWQHLAQARLRAVEQGLPLLRAANTGISAVIDAKGRMVAHLPMDTYDWLDTDVPPALPPPPYARWGDLPATILLVAGLLMLGSRKRPYRH